MKKHIFSWVLGVVLVCLLFGERALNSYSSRSTDPVQTQERFNFDTLMTHASEVIQKATSNKASEKQFVDSITNALEGVTLSREQLQRAANEVLSYQRELEEKIRQQDTINRDTIIYHKTHRDTVIIDEVHVSFTITDTVHQQVVIKDTVQGTGWNKKRKKKRRNKK